MSHKGRLSNGVGNGVGKQANVRAIGARTEANHDLMGRPLPIRGGDMADMALSLPHAPPITSTISTDPLALLLRGMLRPPK